MKFSNIITLINICAYFLLESIVIAIPVYYAYLYNLEQLLMQHLSYVQIVIIIWIIKVSFFDVFKFNLNSNIKENK